MAHSDVRLLTSPEGYQLALGEEKSDLVDFGEPLEWEAPNGKRYLAYVDLPEGKEEAENVESELDSWVYEVKPLSHVEPEDAEEGEGDQDDEEEDDEDEDDEDEDTQETWYPDEVESPSANGDDDEDEEDDEEPIYG